MKGNSETERPTRFLVPGSSPRYRVRDDGLPRLLHSQWDDKPTHRSDLHDERPTGIRSEREILLIHAVVCDISKHFTSIRREEDQPSGLWFGAQFSVVHEQTSERRPPAHRDAHGIQPRAAHPDLHAAQQARAAAPFLRLVLPLHRHV